MHRCEHTERVQPSEQNKQLESLGRERLEVPLLFASLVSGHSFQGDWLKTAWNKRHWKT